MADVIRFPIEKVKAKATDEPTEVEIKLDKYLNESIVLMTKAFAEQVSENIGPVAFEVNFKLYMCYDNGRVDVVVEPGRSS